MFSYSTSVKFDLSSLKATPSNFLPSQHPPSQHSPSQHQVSHGPMSCLSDSNLGPNPDQVALGGLHPEIFSVNLSRRQWPTAFLLEKAQRSHPIHWHLKGNHLVPYDITSV
jgi:hypothetical protein